ncbi:MAG TPA: hypothetical protein ACFYD7_01215 [Candidatus Wujingus californicus]|uniref:hypothetical protein n=1 Tax=Candidatus Wujingus californicus TaxID=3367618 RepID=UPI001E067E12|nr:hypothetical protein [Planctomycetota bacterium]MDO8131752.1 hypothetical protein [Candidatus Brocadiales bacterium]
MDLINKEELIFSITKDWIQKESNQSIERNLTGCELYTVKKCIEWGLLTDIDTVFKTAIREAIKKSQL